MNKTIIITVSLIVIVALLALYVCQMKTLAILPIRTQRIREVPVDESQPYIYRKAVEDKKGLQEEVKEVKRMAKPTPYSRPVVIQTLQVETPAESQ